MSENVKAKVTTKFTTQIADFGIKPSIVHRNLTVQELIDTAVKKNEGINR